MDKPYKTSLNPLLIAAGATSAQAWGPNPRRAGLILSPLSAGRYTISFGAEAALDQGVTITAGVQPLVLWRAHFGSALELPAQIIASAAGQTVAVLEIVQIP